MSDCTHHRAKALAWLLAPFLVGLVARPAEAQVYEFAAAVDGWSAGDCATLAPSGDGAAVLTATCQAPSVRSPSLTVDAAASPVLTVVATATITGPVDLRFTSGGVERVIRRALMLRGDGAVRAYSLALAGMVGWAGTITQVSLTAPEATSGTVSLLRISFDPVPFRGSFSFERDGDIEGWTPTDTVSGLAATGGAAFGTVKLISATKPRLQSPGWIRIDSRTAKSLSIRIKATSPTAQQSLRVWWGTASAPTLNVARSMAQTYAADGAYHTVHFDLFAHAKWREDIVALWVQPFDAPEDGASFSFDDIAFEYALDTTTAAQSAMFTTTGADGVRIADGGLRGVVTSPSGASITFATRATAALYDRIVVVGTFDAGLPCSLGVAFKPTGGVFATVSAVPNCEGQRFAAVIDVSKIAAWTGRIDAIRIDLPGTSGTPRRAFRLERVALQHAVAAPELTSVTVPSPIAAGTALVLTATVQNRGTEPSSGGKVIIAGTPDFLPTIPPFGTATVTRTLATQTSCSSGELASVTVTGQFTNAASTWTSSVSVNPTWVDPVPELPPEVPPAGAAPSSLVLDRAVVIQNDAVRLVLTQDSCLNGYGRLHFFGATPSGWQKVGSSFGLGRVVLDEGDGVSDLTLGGITLKPLGGTNGAVVLEGTQLVTTSLGTTWTFAWTFTLRAGRHAVEVMATASPNLSSAIRLFESGFDVVDPGTYASAIPRAVFGGFELTSGPSSSSLGLIGLDGSRRSPDPRAATLPVMAVSATDPASSTITAGLAYPVPWVWSNSSARRSLSLRFDSPAAGQGSSRLAVRVPDVPSSIAPGDTLAAVPFAVAGGETLSLSYQLFARAEPAPEAAMRAFWEMAGISSPPAVDAATASLRTRAALASSFVSGQGWTVRTGSAPVVAGDVAVAAAALADAAADAALAGKVSEALALPVGAGFIDGVGGLPTFDAPWRLAVGAPALEGAWSAIKAELAAGPSVTAGLLDGAPTDAGGWRLTARLARFARLTGLAEARLAAVARLDAALASWPSGGLAADGVSAAAPDLASITDAVFAFVEGHRLTGDAAYLARAKMLGFAALTFVVSGDIPGVTPGLAPYGAVSAYAARGWVDSLVGQLSATQGARLAVALGALGKLDAGGVWTAAAGRLRDAVYRRQNALDGSPTAGWVSDAYDLRASASGDQAVVPFIAARATLELAGELVSTADVSTPAGLSVRLAGSGAITSPSFDPKSYTITASFLPTSTTRASLLTAGNLPAPPEAVSVGGTALPSVTNLDSAASGWQYLPSIQVVAIKLAPRASAATIAFVYPIPDKDGDGAPANVDCNDDVPSVHPGATETCNAVDDDCDGDTDDPDATGYQHCGIAQCEHDEPKCILGVFVPCNPLAGKTVEICDSKDNDCDGYTDEEVGLVACGTGACKRLIDACDVCDPFVGKDDESCDGVDNDCDGETDETVGTVLCGTGRCEHLIGVCSDCDPLAGQAPEECNLIDDDCDGQTDEDQPTVACGTGLCLHDIPQCAACDETVGSKKEVCNLIDDDCDGETDDGTPTVACGKGVCERQIPACSPCDPLVGQKPEVCNGTDDDCNGVVDDAAGVKPCGTGECYHEIPKCAACDATTGQIDEVCDGRDNDCDGSTDELTGQAVCGLGICAHPVDGCGACEALLGAVDEQCDGLDDDCDGQTDEVDDLGTFVCGIGGCARTLPNCTAGLQTACDELVGQATEACDGQDNDCDGVTDEDIDTWTCGIGGCAQTITDCTDPSACDPLKGQKSETCNGADDDCDGLTDEDLGFITCGELIGCPQAIPKCWQGKTLECNPSGLAPDICDGVDNDCDSQTDENIPVVACGVGVCLKTVPGCTGGAPTVCDPMAGASEEICDFVDNDCDGGIDESSPPTTCGLGICASTVSGCVGGFAKTCTPKDVAKPDVCNGADDDCDGETDEGQGTITCGKGKCVREVELCKDGVPQACDADTGQAPEECNGQDDDCDGETDEELGQVSCGLGECNRVLQACVNAAPSVCDAFAGLKPERCDGKDNDCDGATDDSLGEITCDKGGGEVLKAAACKNGVPVTCDDVAAGGTDATDGGTTTPGAGVSAPPARGSRGSCAIGARSSGLGAAAALFAAVLGLWAVRRRAVLGSRRDKPS